MLIVSIVASFVFLGGWLSPFTIFNIFPNTWLIFDGFYWGIFWLFSKAIFLVFVMMWFRWTFPRLRVDQLMYTCWKVFIPFSLANLFLVTIWELVF
jgi:NADH-quinone oxidoreductase subunit H